MKKNDILALITIVGVAVVSSAVTYAVLDKPCKCKCKRKNKSEKEEELSENAEETEISEEDEDFEDINNIPDDEK